MSSPPKRGPIFQSRWSWVPGMSAFTRVFDALCAGTTADNLRALDACALGLGAALDQCRAGLVILERARVGHREHRDLQRYELPAGVDVRHVGSMLSAYRVGKGLHASLSTRASEPGSLCPPYGAFVL